jgi:F-box protein 9
MSDTEPLIESTEVDLGLEGLRIDDFSFDKKKSEKEQAIIEGGDEDELERFRQEWKAEVKGRRGLRNYGIPLRESAAQELPKQVDRSVTSPERSPKKSITSPFAENANLPDATVVRSPTQNGRTLDAGPSRPKKHYSAVQLYAQAVENEQAGQLNDALQLYRKAFKIDGESLLTLHSSLTLQIMLIGSIRNPCPNM